MISGIGDLGAALSLISLVLAVAYRGAEARLVAASAALVLLWVMALLPPDIVAVSESLRHSIKASCGIGVAPFLLFRPTMLVFAALAIGGVRRAAWVVAANMVISVAALAAVAWLSKVHADASNLVAVLVVSAGVAETLNVTEYVRVQRRWDGLRVAPVSVALAIVTCLVGISYSLQDRLDAANPGGRRIALWWPSVPLPDFHSSADGFSWANIGLWGDLPPTLERGGFRVTKVSELTREELAGVHALALLSPFRRLTETERTAVSEYTNSGGRLFVIGEHTNLEGVRDVFNPMIEPAGISLNFDTTNPLWGDRALTLSVSSGRLGQITRATTHITHNRGASLTLSGSAEPIMIGRWWHGDHGELWSSDKGFLSDYRTSPEDDVGDLVLAAQAPQGRGAVVVWGDSSPFINQNIAYNSRFVHQIFSAVAGEPLGLSSRIWLAVALGLLSAISLVIHRQAAFFAVVAALVITVSWRSSTSAPLPPPGVVISDAENNEFSRDPFAQRSVTGLGVWASRNEHTPWLGDWRFAPGARLIFIINPRIVVTERYVNAVRRAASDGATIVISGGGTNDSFVTVAQRFGANVTGPPLGSIDGPEVTTYSCWRMESKEGRTISVKNVPIGVLRTFGKGRVVFIADEGLLLSKSLEGERTYDEKNQTFLQRLVLQ